METDQRFENIYNALNALRDQQIWNILLYEGEMCYDTYNFDPNTKRYWPFAVALGVPKANDIETMTDQLCKEKIREEGFDTNPMSGVLGEFYTTNRKKDIELVCWIILSEQS